MKKVIVWAMMLLLLTGCAGNIKDGVTLLKEGKYEEAVEAFQKDVDKERNLDEAYRGLGIAYFELKEYESAAEAFEMALKNETKETAIIYSFLGACYMELEKYDLALDSYEKALTQKDLTEEMKQEIQFNLIALYENMGNWDAAKKQLKKYAELYPDDSRIEKETDFLEMR